MKTQLLIPIFLAAFACAHAQVRYEAPLPPVKSKAFHDIVLAPAVSAHISEKAENLRILDSSGVEIPYLFNLQEPSQLDIQLKWYPERGESQRWRRYSRSIFENPRRDAIDEMVLKVRNADVSQHFWLSGSDDNMDWHIIKEDFVYESSYDLSSTYNLITLQFPPVDYRFYKVEVRHHWREPIDVMGAGYYRVHSQEGRYIEIPQVAVSQTEDAAEGRSFVEIDLGGMHYVDRLHLEIDGPERYFRNAVLEGDALRKEVNLSSKEVARFEFDGLRTGKLRLAIDNLDDRPIRVVRARAYQLRRSVTAQLWPGMEASVVLYPEGRRAPAYDLVHFSAELPTRRPLLSLDSLQEVGRLDEMVSEAAIVPMEPSAGLAEEAFEGAGTFPPEKEECLKSWLQHPAALWAGIIGIALLLLWFSSKALKEKPGQEES